MSPPKLLIFDCDGVLVDSEPLVNQAEAGLFSRWGWSLTPHQAAKAFKGKAFAEIAAVVQLNTSALPSDWMFEWAMEIARFFQKELQPIEGIHAALDYLAPRFPICVASQSSLSRVRLSLALCNLSHHFEGLIFTASMVERPKPAPDLFLCAARSLNTNPADCVVIEDSITGVQAAVAEGMRVLGYSADEGNHDLERAGAIVFHDMRGLPALLERG